MQIINKQKLLYNCDLLLCESIEFYKGDHFPRSCFLAMTAIEEAGKIPTLWLNPGFIGGPPDYSKMSQDEINKRFHDHRGKACEAAGLTLSKNEEADRRYGIDPSTKIHWTSGVKRLVDAGRWMDQRNTCLYVDVAPGKSETTLPQEAVLNDHASYMICMGHEVVADLADAGIIDHNPDPWLRFKSTVIERLQDFRKHYAESFEWSNLGLFADSEALQSRTKVWSK